MEIEIRLLGPLEVAAGGGVLGPNDFPSRKAKQVLQVLALAGGRVVTKDRLSDTLWRRRLPQNPSATVELAVSLLRTALASISDAAPIVTVPGGYHLDLAVVGIDTFRFDRLLEQSAELPLDERAPVLSEAVALARAPLCEDEAASEWVLGDRERFRVKADAAALDLGRLALSTGDVAVAMAMSERVRGHAEAVVEEAYVLGANALLHDGRIREARALLDELELRLADEEARQPGAEATRLRQLLSGPQDPRPTTPVRVPEGFARLEVPLVLRGRERELADLEAAVRSVFDAQENGVVVIDAHPGFGATRLLTELGERAPDDVTVVRLTGTDEDRVHDMLGVGHLVRALGRAARSRRSVAVDPSVATMFGRLAAQIESLGRVMILVDDHHLLDAASAAVLRALVTPGAVADLVLVVTLPTGWEGTFPVGAVRQSVTLGLLDPVAFVDVPVDNAAELTGGHAATLAVCVAAARRDGTLSREEEEVLLRRVRPLGQLGLELLQAAAGFAPPFKAVDLAHARRIGYQTVVDLVRLASEAGLLQGSVRDGHRFTSILLADVLRSRATAAH